MGGKERGEGARAGCTKHAEAGFIREIGQGCARAGERHVRAQVHPTRRTRHGGDAAWLGADDAAALATRPSILQNELGHLHGRGAGSAHGWACSPAEDGPRALLQQLRRLPAKQVQGNRARRGRQGASNCITNRTLSCEHSPLIPSFPPARPPPAWFCRTPSLPPPAPPGGCPGRR